MKKILSVLCTMILIFTCVGCASNSGSPKVYMSDSFKENPNAYGYTYMLIYTENELSDEDMKNANIHTGDMMASDYAKLSSGSMIRGVKAGGFDSVSYLDYSDGENIDAIDEAMDEEYSVYYCCIELNDDFDLDNIEEQLNEKIFVPAFKKGTLNSKNTIVYIC